MSTTVLGELVADENWATLDISQKKDLYQQYCTVRGVEESSEAFLATVNDVAALQKVSQQGVATPFATQVISMGKGVKYNDIPPPEKKKRMTLQVEVNTGHRDDSKKKYTTVAEINAGVSKLGINKKNIKYLPKVGFVPITKQMQTKIDNAAKNKTEYTIGSAYLSRIIDDLKNLVSRQFML